MAVRVDELLTSAEGRAWEIARDVPPPAVERRGSDGARAYATAMHAAWPVLARATLATMDALPADEATRERVGPARVALERIGRDSRRIANGPATDPVLAAVSREVGAVGDLIAASRADGPGYGPVESAAAIDRLLAVTDSLARSTRGFTAHAWTPSVRPSTALLDDLTHAVQAAGVYRDRPSLGALGDLSRPVRAESSVLAAVASWRTQAAMVLDPATAASSSRAVRDVAADTAIIHATTARVYEAAAIAGLLPAEDARVAARDHVTAAGAWRDAAAAWHPRVGAGGPPAPEYATVARALRGTVQAAVTDGTRMLPAEQLATSPGLPSLVAQVRRASEQLPTVAATYAETTGVLVRSQVLWTPARRMSDEVQPVPADTLTAARRGAWVPLPATGTTGTRLTETANTARTATTTARASGDAAAAAYQPPSLTDRITEIRARIDARQRHTRTTTPTTTADLADPPAARPRGLRL